MLEKALKILIPGAIIAFLFYSLLGNLNGLKNIQFTASPPLFVLSVMLYTASVAINSLLWHAILEKLTKRKIDIKKVILVSIYSWLVRYVPGKILSVLGKITYGGKILQIPKKIMTKSIIFEYTYLSLGSLVFILALFDLVSIPIILILLLILVSIKFKFLLHGYILGRLLLGVSFFLMVQSVYPVQGNHFFYLTSSFIVATILGFFAFFTPGGLGVREGFLAFFLSKIYPMEVAVAISLAARVWAVLGDILLFGFLKIRRVGKLLEFKYLDLVLLATFAAAQSIIYINKLLEGPIYLVSDEAIYALLAQRFLSGDFVAAVHPHWNPGLPLASIPFYFLTGRWETAQILVAMTAHILLIFVLYFTLKKISRFLGLIAAFLATVSPAFGSLIAVSSASAILYTLLLWLGIYFGWAASTGNKSRDFILTGLFLGLAYLTRTEALFVFITYVLILGFSVFFKKRRKPKIINKLSLTAVLGGIVIYLAFVLSRWELLVDLGLTIVRSTRGMFFGCIALALVSIGIYFQKADTFPQILRKFVPQLFLVTFMFFLVNLPYITILSNNLGKFTISGKYAYIGSLHAFAPLPQNSLTTRAQDVWSIDYPDYSSPLYKRQRILPAIWKNLATGIEEMWKKTKESSLIYTGRIFGGLEAYLIYLGLATILFLRKFRKFGVFILVIFLGNLLPITYFMGTNFRYLGFAIPIFWTIQALGLTNATLLYPKFSKPLSILLMLAVSGFILINNLNPDNLLRLNKINDLYANDSHWSYQYSQKYIGEWLKARNINVVMARTEGISFYSGGKTKIVYIPAAPSLEVIEYAKAWGVEYLLARPVELSWSYMKELTDPEFELKDLQLVHTFEDLSLLWHINLSESEKSANLRLNRGIF